MEDEVPDNATLHRPFRRFVFFCQSTSLFGVLEAISPPPTTFDLCPPHFRDANGKAFFGCNNSMHVFALRGRRLQKLLGDEFCHFLSFRSAKKSKSRPTAGDVLEFPPEPFPVPVVSEWRCFTMSPMFSRGLSLTAIFAYDLGQGRGACAPDRRSPVLRQLQPARNAENNAPHEVLFTFLPRSKWTRLHLNYTQQALLLRPTTRNDLSSRSKPQTNRQHFAYTQEQHENGGVYFRPFV